MSKGAIGFWVGVAWIAAVLTSVAAIYLGVNYGVIEVPGGEHRIINWVLIAGCAIIAVYSVLFAVAMSIIKESAEHSYAALYLLLDRHEGAMLSVLSTEPE